MIGLCAEGHGHAPGGLCFQCERGEPANDVVPAHLREAAPECERVPFWWIDELVSAESAGDGR